MTSILNPITNNLAHGKRVESRGFGSFTSKIRNPRIGRDPRSGGAVQVETKQVPTFRAWKQLLMRLNPESWPPLLYHILSMLVLLQSVRAGVTGRCFVRMRMLPTPPRLTGGLISNRRWQISGSPDRRGSDASRQSSGGQGVGRNRRNEFR
ncbi:hypothetical protein E4191_19030 (plasmid) [Paracoccus liaowanqingii]|uniref:Integration host factor subunit beta n=1 Tax=Paracoccus liaowanqingii TaxID=2560053 RepID=A0A4Y5SRV7_9RHOB|nr:hypothetical protein E4191_19030 [Paracoccus liaowanqingii]